MVTAIMAIIMFTAGISYYKSDPGRYANYNIVDLLSLANIAISAPICI